jgi:hypothetical protein
MSVCSYRQLVVMVGIFVSCLDRSAGVDLSGWATYQCQGHCSRIDTIPRHMPTWLRNVVVCIPRQEYRSTSIRAGVSFGAAVADCKWISLQFDRPYLSISPSNTSMPKVRTRTEADRVLNRQSRASSHRKGSRSKQPRQL